MSQSSDEFDKIKAAALAAIQRFHSQVSAEELQAKVGNATCSVLLNAEFVICYATPPLERLFGYESEQLEGQHINVLVPEDRREVHLVRLSHYAADPQRREMNHRTTLPALHRTGRVFAVKIELSPVYFHGLPYFMGQVFESSAE